MSEQPAKIHIDPARATALAEMTPYQNGAVVSRTLLQHDTGTLTVFSRNSSTGQLAFVEDFFDTLDVDGLGGASSVTVADMSWKSPGRPARRP